MAQKSGRLKRFLLGLLLVTLLVVVFILLGGDTLIKSAGRWITGVGKKAEDMRETMEQKADKIEKTIEKVKEIEKSGEKK